MKNKKEEIVKPFMKDGFETVTLHKDGVGKDFPVHVLVAQTFVPNPDNKSNVRHKDGNKLNNRADNLEWY